jgi:hypothetical protein
MANFGTIIFDTARHGIAQIIELHASGVTTLCPRCRSPFIVALTHEEAKRHRVHPGIYCPPNPKHFTMLFELRSDFCWMREPANTPKGNPAIK